MLEVALCIRSPLTQQQKEKTEKRINKLTQTKKRSKDGKWQRQASFTSITFTQATQPKRWENILIWNSFLNEIRLMFNYEFFNAFQTTIEQHHQQQLNEQCNANKDTLMTHPRVDGCWQMFHLGILQVLIACTFAELDQHISAEHPSWLWWFPLQWIVKKRKSNENNNHFD